MSANNYTIAQRLFHTYSSIVAVRLASKLRVTYLDFDRHIVHVFNDGSGLSENKADGAISVYHED